MWGGGGEGSLIIFSFFELENAFPPLPSPPKEFAGKLNDLNGVLRFFFFCQFEMDGELKGKY